MKPAKEIFELMKKEGCRQITFHHEPKTGLQLVLVIDSFPELRDKAGKLSKNLSVSGGTRFAHQDADSALADAVKLARAMARKARVLDVNEGGCKAVVLANQKSKHFLNAIGDFIQLHKGLFKTAVDLGFNLKDAEHIAAKTDFVDSLSHVKKGLGSTGENTAEGMLHGFDVICKEILKKPLQECSVAIQGLGAVGMPLAEKLVKRGCRVVGTDLLKANGEKARKIGVKIVSPQKILFQKVDILSPCALGAVINRRIIPKLQCTVIAGGANNPLEQEFKDEKTLLRRGIIFVPDFVLNCGGFLQALVEREKGTVQEARQKAKIVGQILQEVIEQAKKQECTLLEAATFLFDRESPRMK
ncbi:MAG: hypothetical protein Q8R53_02675 [Nanoarchaeota archaeon]|nr:hypothetical protein [Nanoarchaeota archaeon]